MKFLLVAINAKYIHSNPAVYSLQAYAESKGVKGSEIAEYTINQKSEQILADIYRRKPEAIGFSCYIWNMEMVEILVGELPKILPGVPIWLGGPEVSFAPEIILQKFRYVTGIMTGEGEATFTELLSLYEKDIDVINYENIKGVYTREGKNPERELLSMDEIPFLYAELTEFKNRIIYYESSRGCPFRCSYCLSSIDKTVRLRSQDKVMTELQFFLEQKVPQVKFIDRTFNCNHQHATAIWQYLKENDNGVTNFHFEIAADLLTEEELCLLNSLRAGLVQLEIGVQTTNEETLRGIQRHMDMEKLAHTIASIRRGNNIHIHLDLIAGLPYEGYESFGKSFDDVYAMKPEQLQLGFLKVLKGSPMYESAAGYGINYTDKPPYEVLYSKWLSYEEILGLKRIEEMVELYYNSGQFVHVLPVLEERFHSPFRMFEALANFYEEKQYFINSPARAYRYHILLEFAQEQDEERMALYKELCTFDMYLRENLKSRPSFSEDLIPYYELIQGFYKQEEKTSCYLKEGYEGLPSKTLMKMTHMERFTYPVWMEDGTSQKKNEEPGYILFDYKERSPLTKEAKTYLVAMPERKSYES